MKIPFLFALTSLILLGCVSQKLGNKSPDIPIPTSVNVNKQSFDSLTIKLSAIEEKSIIPGFAVAILTDQEILYKKGFGYSNLKEKKEFNTQTVNFIASISKTFIGVSIMKLIEMNKLDLDEKINDILPYEIINPHYPNVPITVRHLVTHTAGLIEDFDAEDVGESHVILLEELTYESEEIQEIMDDELDYYRLGEFITLGESLRKYLSKDGNWYSKSNFNTYPPGTKYEYSNLGAELASRIVELKSGMEFNKFTEKFIFEPLKMNNTGWFYNDIDNALISKIYHPDNWDNPTIAIEHPKYQHVGYTSGDLKSNIDDLCIYLTEMMNGYNGKGRILKPESYQVLFEPQLTESYFEEDRAKYALSDEYDVGVFWAVSSTGIRLHNGGSIGVFSFLYFNPESNTGAVGFANLPDGSFGAIRDLVYEYEIKMRKK